MMSYTVHTTPAMNILTSIYSEVSHISCVLPHTPYIKSIPKYTFGIPLMRHKAYTFLHV
jgi:hypothetical protein